jgi:2-polyprenyl-3-methyl-5-hydroxy-6-metoxy-1,4-benzoquinol methylase
MRVRRSFRKGAYRVEEEHYRKFFEIEERHWWFVARQMIVEDLIQRRCGVPRGADVLDVGCGTGAILKMLSQRYRACGIDASELAIDFCRLRGLTNAVCCTLDSFPNPGLRFDLVTALDVIEHIDDDLGVVRKAAGFLKPGGALLVSVPAYQFLWSAHDERNHHKRRYVKSRLRDVLVQGGLKVEMLSYFNTILFPLALTKRLTDKLLKLQGDELALRSPILNHLLQRIFAFERIPLRRISFPFGLSLIAVGRTV